MTGPSRGLQSVILFLCFAIGLSEETATAQTCPPTPVVPNTLNSADISLTYGPEPVFTCTITPNSADRGTYIKYQTTYRFQIHVQTNGQCQTFIQNDYCDPSVIQIRPLTISRFWSSLETLNDFTNPIAWYSQNYSTLVSGQTTGAPSFWPTVLGNHIITSTTQAGATDCGFAPTLIPQNNTLDVNVVKCAPGFKTPNAYPNLQLKLAPGTINIYVPSTLTALLTSLTNAVTQWNAAIAGTGVVLGTPSTTDCGTGPNCIRVDEKVMTDCGEAGGLYNTATGHWLAPAININSSWSLAGNARLQRTFAHELGHLLGLNTNFCAGPDSVMKDGVYSCTSTDPNVPNTPTLTDTLPVNSSVYGGRTKAYCGF